MHHTCAQCIAWSASMLTTLGYLTLHTQVTMIARLCPARMRDLLGPLGGTLMYPSGASRSDPSGRASSARSSNPRTSDTRPSLRCWVPPRCHAAIAADGRWCTHRLAFIGRKVGSCAQRAAKLGPQLVRRQPSVGMRQLVKDLLLLLCANHGRVVVLRGAESG
jgi:hypothetical protein